MTFVRQIWLPLLNPFRGASRRDYGGEDAYSSVPRCLAPGAPLYLFSSTTTNHRRATATKSSTLAFVSSRKLAPQRGAGPGLGGSLPQPPAGRLERETRVGVTLARVGSRLEPSSAPGTPSAGDKRERPQQAVFCLGGFNFRLVACSRSCSPQRGHGPPRLTATCTSSGNSPPSPVRAGASGASRASPHHRARASKLAERIRPDGGMGR